MKRILLVLLPLSFFLVACPGGKITKPKYMNGVIDVDELPSVESKFERFRQQIMGHFSNKEQVKKDETMGEPEQEFIITPIFKNRPNEFWIYMEYFSPGLVEKPLDQRIEQYVRIDRDTFLMEVYYLKEPELYVNEWKKQEPFKDLSIRHDLIRDDKCDLLIVPQEGERYKFKTVLPEEVVCEMRGNHGATKYVDLFFNLSDQGYNMRHKFYDRGKKVLRETDPRGIDFKRLDYKSEDYIRYE